MTTAMRMTRVAMLSAVMTAAAAIPAHAMQADVVTVGDPQVKDDLFAGTEKFAQGASDVTNIDLGPDMLGMIGGKQAGDLAHKMNFILVRTYTYPSTGMYKLDDVEVYRQKLRSGNWNCFIHTYQSKSGDSADICNRALPNHEGNEMVLLTVAPKELTFIHMSGDVSLEDLSKLGAFGNMNVAKPSKPSEPSK
jgi:Domain of unknown function (DUF4252)